MRKKHAAQPPSAMAQPFSAPSEIQLDSRPEAETEAALPATKDFEWDCGDTRYNIGDKVFRSGARLTNIPIDEDGSPKDAALKAAYEHNYLKKAAQPLSAPSDIHNASRLKAEK